MAGVAQAEATVRTADFDPFVGEPVLMARVGQAGRRWWIIAGLPLAALLVLLAIELPLSAIRHSVPGSTICGDLYRLIGRFPLVPSCPESRVADFPPTRDYFSLIGMLSLLLTPFVAARQWTGISTFVSGMIGAGSLKFVSPDDRAELDRQIRLANDGIRGIAALSPLVMLVAAGAMTGLILVEARNGVFAALAPRGITAWAWAHVAYTHWWAGVNGDIFGLVIYFLVGSFGLYLITIQNLVTLRILLALVRARKAFEFAVDPVDSDGYYGWRPVRVIASATYAELAIHGIGLAAVGATLPHGGIFTTYFYAAGQWLIILIIAIAFPPIFSWRKVRRFKRREVDALTTKAREQGATMPEYERIHVEDAYRKRIELIRHIPMLPYKKLRDVFPFAMAIIADTYAVGAILAALWRAHTGK